MDLLEPLTAYNIVECDNVASKNAESMILSVKIKSQVEQMISHVLSFGSVLTESDRRAITILCQKVWRECIALTDEYSLTNSDSHDDTTHPGRNETTQRMKAEILESSLCRLERLINDSLLRLVFNCFEAINQNPFKNLINDETNSEDFDGLNDALLQIGIFAVAFADDSKAKSIIRSSLASLESLEEHLIPSIIIADCTTHSKLLQDHWLSEVNILQFHIQKIIDTHAFCESLLDILGKTIELTVRAYDRTVIERCLCRCDIFLAHFNINATNLWLTETASDLDKFERDYRLMISECRAAVEADVTKDRIVKRLRILKSILNRALKVFKKASDSNGADSATAEGNFAKLSSSVEDDHGDDVEDSDKYFESFGIKPKQFSVLYKSTRRTSELTVPISMKNVTVSTLSVCRDTTMGSFRSRKKRKKVVLFLRYQTSCV